MGDIIQSQQAKHSLLNQAKRGDQMKQRNKAPSKGTKAMTKADYQLHLDYVELLQENIFLKGKIKELEGELEKLTAQKEELNPTPRK